jgi:hypothetical protein
MTTWKCPVCETPVGFDGDVPEPNCLYRCHACRVALEFDVYHNRLVVAALPSDNDPRR